MDVNLSILNNVDNRRLIKFMSKQGCEYTEHVGIEMKYWIKKLNY